MKKDYKKLYEEEKAKRLLEKHEKKYLHIPFNLKAIGRFFLLLLSILLAVGNFFVLKANYNILFSINSDYTKLGLIPQLIFQYVLISVVFICLVALIKGGFNKLKKFQEGLIGGLIGGLIIGLFGGLIGGLFEGLIIGLFGGLIGGLIGGLFIGLFISLFIGLFGGLFAEFRRI